MADRAFEQLLEQRVTREPSQPVSQPTVDRWIAIFGSRFPIDDVSVVHSIMATTFSRSPLPPAPGESAATGVVLHDQLKQLLDLPVAIAIGYELELLGSLHLGDQLVSVERIADVGPERSTRFGPGRDWIIEVATSALDGSAICIEQFRMMGYRPGDRSGGSTALRSQPPVFEWTEEVSIDADLIIGWASAHRVWAAAHHDSEVARDVGLPDIILDTSSQVSLLAGAAHHHRPDQTLQRVQLEMKRPILPGATVLVGGVESGATSTVSAMVDGREASRAIITFTS